MRANGVYLDHAATTPLDERVLKAMTPYFDEMYGNPSSVHQWGQRAEAAMSEARQIVADALGCDSDEVIFTSGGTESDNLALAGVARARREAVGANLILTTPVEHEAVIRTAERLAAAEGFQLQLLPVSSAGQVDPDELLRLITPETAVVSIIHANNEIGTLNDLAPLGSICRDHRIPLHTDAVQSMGQLRIDVPELRVDLLSIGGHKLYGPKGVGALYLRAGTPLHALLSGGGQEFGLRPGTGNVPLVVGLAEAIRLNLQDLDTYQAHYRELRDRIIDGVLGSIPDSVLTGHRDARLPNHASFVFKGVDGNALLAALDFAGFACSSGSACKTGEPEPSRVLEAIGLAPDYTLGSLRVTVGRSTTRRQVDAFLDALPAIVERLRASSLVTS